MSAPRIYLDRLPSFCQNYQNRWKFDAVLTKTNLLSFFGTRCIKREMCHIGYCANKGIDTLWESLLGEIKKKCFLSK